MPRLPAARRRRAAAAIRGALGGPRAIGSATPWVAVLAANGGVLRGVGQGIEVDIPSTVEGNPLCWWDPGSPWSYERCCLGGGPLGLAECWDEAYTYERPPDASGRLGPLSAAGGCGWALLEAAAGDCWRCCIRRLEPVFSRKSGKDKLKQLDLLRDAGHMRSRGDFFAFLITELQMTGMAVELGTQDGHFAEILLQGTNLSRYYAVDIWTWLEDYEDHANVGNEEHAERLRSAVARLSPFWPRVRILQEFTQVAARLFEDGSLDFVFVDAAHDYCSVTEDLRAYWDKLRIGGIFSGHDYLTQDEVDSRGPHMAGQRWDRCRNGTVHRGAVKQAVLDFAQEVGLKVYTTSDLFSDSLPSWFIQKIL